MLAAAPLGAGWGISTSMFGSTSLAGGVDLDWLWEDRPDEQVPPGPSHQRARGAVPRATPRAALQAALSGGASCRPSVATPSSASGGGSKSARAPRSRRAAAAIPSLTLTSADGLCTPSAASGRPPAAAVSARCGGSSSSRPPKLLPLGVPLTGFRRASRGTLLEATGPAAIPDSVPVWRGTGLAASLEYVKWEALELARYRRDCIWTRASKDRQKASSWLQRKLRESDVMSRWGQAEHGEADWGGHGEEDSTAAEAQMGHADSGPSEPHTHRAHHQARPSAATPAQLSQTAVKFFEEEAPVQTELPARGAGASSPGSRYEKMMLREEEKAHQSGEIRRGTLFVGEPKSRGGAGGGGGAGSGVEQGEAQPTEHRGGRRSSSAMNKKRSSVMGNLTRVRRLMEARKAEFDSRPVAERDRLRRAFAVGDPTSRAFLDGSGLRLALAELGLRGSSREEKEAITEVVKEAAVTGAINFFDFVFQLVPKVEQRLQEARSPKLFAAFTQYDVGNAGRMGQQACLQALQHHTESEFHGFDEETQQQFWKGFVHDFPELFRNARYGESTVDFRGFAELAQLLDTMRAEFFHRAERRAAVLGGLPPHVEKAHFGELAVMRRHFVAHDPEETGLLPGTKILHALMECGVLPICGETCNRAQRHFEAMEELKRFRFSDMLTHIERIREEESSVRKAAVQGAMMNPRWKMPIDRDDLPLLVVELGVIADCCPRFNDIVSIVEDCNRDGADHFDMTEVVHLLGKVVEVARVRGRQREADVAAHLGIDREVMLQLRASFSGYSRTGVLGHSEVCAILQNLHGGAIPPVEEEIDSLMEEVLDTAIGAGGYPASVAAHPGHDPMATSRRVLRFDGYMVLLSMMLAEG